MARRFYFTAENEDNEIWEHCGNIRGARTIGKKLANKYNQTVYINDVNGEDIVDVIEPDTVPEEVTEPEEIKEVETTEMCPHCEEEVTLMHDTSKGYKAKCPECGKCLMLCDLCQHRDGMTDENGYIISQGDCDYDTNTDSCRFNPKRKTRAG